MNTIYRLSPGLLYKKAQISLLNTKEGNVTLLLSFPRLNSDIEYQVINIFDLPLRRTDGQQKLLVMIHLPVTQFLVKNRPKFSLANLTRADIATAKSALACEILGQEFFCPNWIDLNLEVKLCLTEILFGRENNTDHWYCRRTIIPVSSHSSTDFWITSTGVLVVHADSVKISAIGTDNLVHVIKSPGLFQDVWQCSFVGPQYKRVIIYADEQVHNISLLKVIATSVWVGPSLNPEGSLTRTYPLRTEVDPIEFDPREFKNMNRTKASPFLTMGVALSPWLSIMGLSLGLGGLTLTCCCLARQKRTLARNRAHLASENMSFERRGTHSRSELTDPVSHETTH